MNLLTLLYGCIWLYMFSPVIVTIVVGLYLSALFSPLVAIFMMLFIAGLYWTFIWMPVRAKFYKLDKEFMEATK